MKVLRPHIRIGLVVATMLLVTVAVLKEKILVLESVNDVQMLWNDGKLVLVVQRRMAVQRTNWLLRKLSQLTGITFPRPTLRPEDLIVFRVEDGNVEKLNLKDTGNVGGVFPLGDRLYFLRGSNPSDYPYLHQLDGDQLVRVPKAEAESVVNSFKLESDILRREGWQKRDLYFTEGRVEYPMVLKGRMMNVVLSQHHQSGGSSVWVLSKFTYLCSIPHLEHL